VVVAIVSLTATCRAQRRSADERARADSSGCSRVSFGSSITHGCRDRVTHSDMSRSATLVRWTSARGSPIALARCRLVPSSSLHTSTRARSHQPVAVRIPPGPEVDGVRREYRLIRPEILSGSKRGTPRFLTPSTPLLPLEARDRLVPPESSGARTARRDVRPDPRRQCRSLRRGSPIQDERNGAARQP
jgi:hypothetical protein